MGAPDSGRSSLKAWVRALELTAPISRNPAVTLPVRMDVLADAFGLAPALISDGVTLSYRALSEQSNRYARWAIEQGLGAGDVVGLFMRNCPEYLAVWLGISRTRCVVSLINANMVADALAHAVRLVSPRHLIVGADLGEAAAAVLPMLAPDLQCWCHGGDRHGFARIDTAITSVPGDRLSDTECAPPSISDRALYIYTSGTTGLPKAAGVSHRRVMQWSHWFAGMLDIRPSDRMYNCLPLFHSVGGVVATGAMLVSGGSVVVRQGFSARSFWEDVADQECTLFQYIGELCRFLVNSPPHPRERDHRLRACCGNGLAADVWEEFRERFRIPRILEFYAATEANFSLFNCEGKPGSIGRIPPFLAHRFPLALVRFDVEAGEPLRDARGFCSRCAPDEVGEAISRIPDDDSAPEGQFEGYSDRRDTERKVLHNVFATGDAWFRTGDLMRRDAAGFFYFVDRVGDTFRWKGENVSTTEVSQVMAGAPGVVEAIAYGVHVPGTDGRAGMAALVVGPEFGLAALQRRMARRLPEYARPVFIRILSAIEQTSTFKPKRQDLSQAGFDPALTTDPIYVFDRSAERFVTLDASLLARVRSGDFRL